MLYSSKQVNCFIELSNINVIFENVTIDPTKQGFANKIFLLENNSFVTFNNGYVYNGIRGNLFVLYDELSSLTINKGIFTPAQIDDKYIGEGHNITIIQNVAIVN